MADHLVPWADEELERLGRRMRAELRAEAHEYERLAATDWLRQRDLAAAATDLANHGDLVTVLVGGQRLTGTVAHAAGDLLCLQSARGAVDVNLAAVGALRVARRSTSGGHRPHGGPGSFRARMFEHEAAGAPVTLAGAAFDGETVGTLTAVARDHVVVTDRDGDTWYVPLAGLDYVAVPLG